MQRFPSVLCYLEAVVFIRYRPLRIWWGIVLLAACHVQYRLYKRDTLYRAFINVYAFSWFVTNMNLWFISSIVSSDDSISISNEPHRFQAESSDESALFVSINIYILEWICIIRLRRNIQLTFRWNEPTFFICWCNAPYWFECQ